MGEAVRWGRLSNGTYETHGTYGLCLKSPVGRVTPIPLVCPWRPRCRLPPPGSWLLDSGSWLLKVLGRDRLTRSGHAPRLNQIE